MIFALPRGRLRAENTHPRANRTHRDLCVATCSETEEIAGLRDGVIEESQHRAAGKNAANLADRVRCETPGHRETQHPGAASRRKVLEVNGMSACEIARLTLGGDWRLLPGPVPHAVRL